VLKLKKVMSEQEARLDGKRNYFLGKESGKGGYEARVLGHSIFTEGDSVDDLKSKIRDAVRCHFEKKELPKIIRLHFIRNESDRRMKIPGDLSSDVQAFRS